MENFIIILVSIIAALCTYYISIRLNKGAVFASATVTLVSGFIFPHFFPQIGGSLAAMATCASYAAMVSAAKFPKIEEMVVLGFINGLLFIATTSAFPGVGGRLGTIAAISGLSWLGMKKVYVTVMSSGKEQVVE
ncbi:MAG: hypothetical protein JJT76_17370 [Clostridiaceae bacterium]|nr:hypothetical protein [Clostridiaceae bacterium]